MISEWCLQSFMVIFSLYREILSTSNIHSSMCLINKALIATSIESLYMDLSSIINYFITFVKQFMSWCFKGCIDLQKCKHYTEMKKCVTKKKGEG